MRTPQIRSLKKERGQAFLLFMFTLLVAAAAIFYTAVRPSNPSLIAQNKNALAFVEAKDALIGFAAANSARPGALPCPDTDNDGVSNPPPPASGIGAACVSNVGRLPWRTLGIKNPQDSAGETLWYAVSPNFTFSSTTPLNSDSVGQLSTIGNATSNIAALIIAPSFALSNQARSGAGITTITNYLELENADSDLEYVNLWVNENTQTVIGGNTYSTSTFNDQLYAISSDQIWPTVERRVVGEVRNALVVYFNANNFYPYPATLTTSECSTTTIRGRIPRTCLGIPAFQPADWYFSNNWDQVTIYALSPQCTPELSGLVVNTSAPWEYYFSNQPSMSCTLIGFFWACRPYTRNIISSAPNCNRTSAGNRLTLVGVDSDLHTVIFTSGKTLAGQSSPRTTITHYLEAVSGDMRNIDSDPYVYIQPKRASDNNDSISYINPD